MMGSNPTVSGASPPPPGVTPDFEHGDSIGYQLILAAVLCPTITVTVWSLRIYTARCIVRKWHLDDLLITIGLIFALANSIIQLIQLNNGVGHHMWDVRLDRYNQFMKLGSIGGAMTYNFATAFIKASILKYYLRFPSNVGFRIATYFTMFVAVSNSLPQAFAWSYLCTPMAKYWDFMVEGKCIDIDSLYVVGASVNVATDIIILLLPIWLLWPLRLPTLQKVALTLTLMTGGFVCAVSIVRLQAITSGLYDPDITKHYVINLTWCLVEMYTGIICACLPTLRAFAKHHFQGLLNNFTNARRGQSLGHSLFTVIAGSLPRPLSAVHLRLNGSLDRRPDASKDTTKSGLSGESVWPGST